MKDRHSFKFGLACLVMAAFTGFVGFLIIYQYATFERPLQRFAVVLDAGSTQTRSSLYALEVDVDELYGLELSPEQPEPPLSDFVQVKQVSTCINGGPLARVESVAEMRHLMHRCMLKFAYHIMRLNFNDNLPELADPSDEELEALDSEEVALKLAALEHRFNSVTRVYLAATAGMRALEQVNSTRAREKLKWASDALLETNQWISKRMPNKGASPYMNIALVDVINGRDEAAFGWISVNFIVDRITVESIPTQPEPERNHKKHTNKLAGDHISSYQKDTTSTLGTLELGGASAQMAFELSEPSQTKLDGLQVAPLELFYSDHLLASRSDLCLGMSQAIIRVSYLILHDRFINQTLGERLIGDPSSSVEVVNPCMQNKARLSLTNEQVDDILNSPCLRSADSDPQKHHFQEFVMSRPTVRFVGTGNSQECSALLEVLIEPHLCHKYFSLCPSARNAAPPPEDKMFVTISGYNKALKILNLQPVEKAEDESEIGRIIEDRLGGFSINQEELVQKTKLFCETDVSELHIHYPDLAKPFYAVNCLQLLYINKLLSQFYHFNHPRAWSQIKFLLFPAREQFPERTLGGSRKSDKNDIGWTLGLLLNATSEQVLAYVNSKDSYFDQAETEIYYHHGATISFIIRTTLSLMLACCLLSICLILFSTIILPRRAKKWKMAPNQFPSIN